MRKRLLFLALVVALAFTAGVVPGKADELLLPDVSPGLPGWSIDRYAPVVFSYLSAVNGINNVIDLGIGTTGNFANRPSAYQSSFYNTQGENNAISGGPGDHLSVLLYIPGSWSSPTNGDVRTDLWVNNADSAYGILGFSNFGTNNELGLYTAGTFQTWNDVTGAWTPVSAQVLYDQWNTLQIQYTNTGYSYYINGVGVGSVNIGAHGGAALTQVLLEAYNFADPTLGVPEGVLTNPVPYDVYYAPDVPEPATFGLIGFGLLGLAAAARRKFRA
jgi:hypothetical protein